MAHGLIRIYLNYFLGGLLLCTTLLDARLLFDQSMKRAPFLVDSRGQYLEIILYGLQGSFCALSHPISLLFLFNSHLIRSFGKQNPEISIACLFQFQIFLAPSSMVAFKTSFQWVYIFSISVAASFQKGDTSCLPPCHGVASDVLWSQAQFGMVTNLKNFCPKAIF